MSESEPPSGTQPPSETEPRAERAEHPSEAAAREATERVARWRATGVRIDSNPALVSLASKLRRRLPGDDRFGDPLSTAGDAPVEVLGRQVSAFQPDRPSVLHQVGLGGLQVWQSVSEKWGRGRGDREVALLFTDLVGFSSWALKAGDEATLELLRAVGVVLEEAVDDHHGTIVKRLGDGLMAVFDAPGEAIDAALAAQEGISGIEISGYRPRMRAGVHAGRPRRLGGDYLGVDVNIAARVGEAAKAGQVLVSDVACEELDAERYETGRAKGLRAAGTPKGFKVRAVSRH